MFVSLKLAGMYWSFVDAFNFTVMFYIGQADIFS